MIQVKFRLVLLRFAVLDNNLSVILPILPVLRAVNCAKKAISV